jgi:hypothetical protein
MDPPATPSVKSPHRAWLGVALDLGLTVVILLLGWDPFHDLIADNAYVASSGLCVLHAVVATATTLIGLMKSDEIGVTDDKTLPGKVTGFSFILFLCMGWGLPVLGLTVGHGPAELIYLCIFSHLSFVPALFLSVIPWVAPRLELLLRWLASPRGLAATGVLLALYLPTVEAFLYLLAQRHNTASELIFPGWAISYLPARLFFARLTGLHGPERYSFVASNVHLLVRLILARF